MKCASRTVRLALSNSTPRVRCGVYRTPHTAPCALFSAVRFLQTNAGHGTDEEDVSPLEEMLLGSFPDQPPPTHNNLDKDYTVERDSTALFPESLVEEQKGQVEAELEGLVTDEDTAFYLTQAEEALADSDELFPDFLYKEEHYLAEDVDSEMTAMAAEHDTPLRIPDKSGFLEMEEEAGETPKSLAHLSNRFSYLSLQDALYLDYPTREEIRMPNTGKEGKCIVIVFASNDLRVHDNYCLSLAVAESVKHYSEHGVYLPIVGVCVLDYRGFAQPSVVGGFYRQSPLRAQFLLDNVRCLRQKLEYQYNIPLLIRCGRPEEHIPRLSVEVNAASVYMTTQYAPHERRVQEEMTRQIREGGWIHRQPYVLSLEDYTDKVDDQRDAPSSMNLNDLGFEVEDLVEVVQHTLSEHPYGAEVRRTPARVHTVWQTTLVHLDDLPTPVALMKEGERWYHDDVTAATIRQTALYDKWTDLLRADDFAGVPDAEKYRNRSVEQIRRAEELTALQREWAEAAELMADFRERKGDAPPSLLRGRLPSLQELGYNDIVEHFQFGEVIATQTSHPPGEDEAIRRVHKWLSEGGMTSMLRYGRERRTNTKLYSQKLSRISPYLSLGVLSPRKFYEMIRQHAHDNLRDGFVHMQYREALLRLSRRDYWHWMGLRYGDRLFFSYGPHPEETDNIPNWRHDAKVVQRWCNALTGIPLADAAMRELTGTGFVADVGRQALVWLLVRGYSQDWRLAAEWLERNSLDFDPFICYGCTAYYTDLMKDDFGEPVRNIHYLAHQHDQTGIYIKRWLPQLSKVHPVYIHRPHVLTPRMQAMHGVVLGRNYPYPIKLWEGAQHQLTSQQLRAYFPQAPERWKGPGFAEALRHGGAVLSPEELHAAVSPRCIQHHAQWTNFLPASAFDDGEEEMQPATVRETVRSTQYLEVDGKP